ncbi:MAG TPA: hypothetical protein VF941_16000 [Clostridia bacterium]
MDLEQGLFNVIRLNNGVSCTHPLFGPELSALRMLFTMILNLERGIQVK